MPRSKPVAAWLQDMLTAAKEAGQFVDGSTWPEYQKNLLLRRAVERSVEIIGEAARQIPREFQEAHPEVPWTKIMRQRHRLAHDYDLIEDETIWRVATVHVPELIRTLQPLIPPIPPDPEPEH